MLSTTLYLGPSRLFTNRGKVAGILLTTAVNNIHSRLYQVAVNSHHTKPQHDDDTLGKTECLYQLNPGSVAFLIMNKHTMDVFRICRI